MNNGHIRVLLIEDNPGDARLIQEMLSKMRDDSLDLECVMQLSSGLERLSEGGVDAVLLDLSLPDSQGLDTFTRMNVQAPQIPIVVLTGLSDETLGVQAVRQGAQDYLVKGQVDSGLLMRAIHYAIERKRVAEVLRGAHRELERRVEERTIELSKLNGKLQVEIAEHKRAERELKALHAQLQEANRVLTLAYAQMRDQKDRLSTLLYLEDMGYLIDRDGRILGATERLLESTGWSRTKLLGSNIVDLTDDDSRRELRRAMDQAWVGTSYWVSVRMPGVQAGSEVFEAKLMRMNLAQEKALLVLMRESEPEERGGG